MRWLIIFINLFLILSQVHSETATVNEIQIKEKEKRKVLVLHILEEHWDDLELHPRKVLVNPNYKPPTIKELLRPYKEYKTKLNSRETKEKIEGWFKSSISKDAALFVYHEINYFGKTYMLKDEETYCPARNIFRWDVGHKYSIYSYNKIPQKILLLKDVMNNSLRREFLWRHHYIRLVNDLQIISSDAQGNLKIKYEGKEYASTIGTVLQLPPKEERLTPMEIASFMKKYEFPEYIAQADRYIEQLKKGEKLVPLSIQKDEYYFKTQVTVINHGYIEIEVE